MWWEVLFKAFLTGMTLKFIIKTRVLEVSNHDREGKIIMERNDNKSNALTRARLSEAIQERYGSVLGLSRQRYIDVVDGFFEEICARLAQGESVKISSFGSFLVNHKSSRIGRNPKTGKEAEIVERKVITFRPSHHLKSRVNLKKA